ncbi:ABC transporter ATP-binding protein [Levilactobacillus zymae]|uniref:ABC transporter ATP-binding protein n=1 Tax=Levilactobacillus zymae TaxID=267363 RepID=A0ABQ0WY69_9LACO|nr:ABC-F family ATP-binding cassette domain-containing protein [Levilactobacillus zymae]KRL12145.1 ABC transporter ATPase [Levilactobacillus zymae DSM 19395]QFR61292.1 ATP-binding cassette domain-containing protein [Levilactobacillus zymae]GEO72488.1 ABC transporter ATP-binding protein [Levilactobacillus zymae]
MILLQVQQVTRRFGATVLFHDVNLDVAEHGRVALVGRNGAGKSTLIKMIAGETTPDEGQITRKRGLTVGYQAQNAGLNSDKSVWDEMLTVFAKQRAMERKIHDLEAQMSDPAVIADTEQFDQITKTYDQLQQDFSDQNGYGYQAEIRGVLHGFEFGEEFYDKPISELSGGQRTQLALAKRLLEKPDLLILDEPTNHLDVETLTWLEGYLQGYPGALLVVSHDRYFLDHVATEVYDMARGSLHHYPGNYSHFIDEKAQRLQQEWKEYDKQQTEISKLEDFVNRNIVRASTTKRAQARRKQLEKMDRLDKPEGDEKVARFTFRPHRQSGNVVLDVVNAAVGYDGQTLCSPINLDIKKHQAIAIVGPNGVGKSTLLKTILGKIPALKGQIIFGTGVDTGYYDQDQANLHDKKTVLHELWDDHPTTPEGDIRSILGSFLFTGADVDKTVHSLSGGEKARLLLTKLALRHDNFLMLDEPTNHLDIDSREVLETALNEFDGTILFVSHDRYFINQVANQVIELSPDGTTRYLGNYDYYVDKKAEQDAYAAKEAAEAEAAHPTVAAPKQTQVDYQQQKEHQKAKRKLSRQVDALEAQMAKLEAQKADIEKTMSQPDYFNDVEKLGDLQQQLDATNQELNTVEDDWTTKSLELEEFTD